MYARLAAANAAEPDYRRLGAACQRHLARIQAEANHREEAATSYQIAIDSYQKIIADFPRYADLWRVYKGLAQSLDATNRPAEADEARQRAVELVSDNARALNNLAWGYATAVDPDVRDASLAVALAEKSFRLDPKNVVVLNTLGVAYYRAGDWQEAIEWLTKAHAVDDGNVKCIDWFFLAMAHWQLGHQDEAREWLSKALAWMVANPNQQIQELPWFKAEAQELIENKQQETVSVPERSKDVM